MLPSFSTTIWSALRTVLRRWATITTVRSLKNWSRFRWIVFRVQCIGGFVKEEVIGVAVNGSGYQYPLLLSLAHTLPGVTYPGVILQGQGLDEAAYICHIYGIKQFLFVHGVIFGSDVVGYGVVEDKSFLHDDPAVLAPLLEAQVLQRLPAYAHLSFRGWIETQYQFYQCWFSAST